MLRLSIHESADIASATAYWSAITGVPATEFRRPVLKRHQPTTNRRNVADDYHGCLSISVRRSTELYRRIEGWFTGVAAGVRAGDYAGRGRCGAAQEPGDDQVRRGVIGSTRDFESRWSWFESRRRSSSPSASQPPADTLAADLFDQPPLEFP